MLHIYSPHHCLFNLWVNQPVIQSQPAVPLLEIDNVNKYIMRLGEVWSVS